MSSGGGVNSTEDKLDWCERFGEHAEMAFAIDRMHHLGVPCYLNPQKAQDKYTHDLCSIFPSDLKTVRTPLFKAREIYGIDPQYAVTFNKKDAQRYRKHYPNIVVIFDVQWEGAECSKEIGGTLYRVEPMRLTAAGFLSDIASAIKASGSHVITYQRRVNDEQGNAKESFVFDVRALHLLKPCPILAT